MKNPFTLAQPVSKKLKILIYGDSGTGKTLAALSFPKCAVIDTEGGTDLYAGRPGIKPFDILRTKSITDLEQAVKFIEADNGKTYETLIIDPISVIYDVTKEASAKSSNGDMTFKDWAKVNSRMKSLYTKLSMLPVHVIMIARESVSYEGSGNSLQKSGTKPDADKHIEYLFDFSIRMLPDHSAEIKKSRGYQFGSAGKLQAVNWSIFEPVANQFVNGATLTIQDDDKIAEREASLLSNKEVATSFYNHWTGQGVENSNIFEALKVSRLSECTMTREEADKAMQDYIDAQLGKSVETPTPSPDEQPAPKAQAPAPAEPKQTGKQFTHRGGLTPDVSNRIGLDDIDSERMALAERGEAVRLARIVEKDFSHQQAWTVLVHHDSGLLRYTMFKDTLDELRLNHKWLNDLFIKDFDINAPSMYPIEFSQPAWVQLGVSKNSKTKKLYPVVKNIHITDEQADAMLQTIASGKQPAIDIQSIYARTQGGKS